MADADRLRAGLRLVSSVAQAFAEHATNLPYLLDTIARRVAETIPDTCLITLRHADGTLTPTALFDADADAVLPLARIIQQRMAPVDAPLSAQALSNGVLFQPHIDLDKLDNLPAYVVARLRAIEARGMIIVPLAVRGEVYGVMNVIRRNPERPAFDELDLELVKDVANHAALAIGNVRLFERIQQNEAVRAAERRAVEASLLLDAIVENIPDMVFVKSAEDLAFVRFNRAGEELLGVARANLLGKTDRDFFPESEAEFFIAKDRETLATKKLVTIAEEPILTKHGTRWLHTKKVPLCDADGEPRYLLGISHDITAQKRADLELRAAIEAAERSNRELEAFSYSVAHDLRAPLRAIDGFSLAILEDAGDVLDPASKANFGRVRQAAQRMAVLIDDLLAMSRVTRATVRRERVDLSALAFTTLSGFQRSEPARDVEIVIEPGLVTEADPHLIAIAFDNLLGNAWKFTSKRARGRIELGATTVDGDRRAYFVRDNGAGFDMTYANKLFGVFQRLHTEADFPGTGIGLATVSRVIQRHHGRVWAEGAVDGGATFYFTLEETP